MLLYFYVYKERKQIAIGRSLGMTKGQCQVSSLSGILILAVVAVLIGNLCARQVMTVQTAEKAAATVSTEDVSETSLENITFSRDFSTWAKAEDSFQEVVLEEEQIHAQDAVAVLVSLLFLALIAISSLVGVNRCLRDDPINLLGQRNS